jgi:hypothetical protein
VREAAGWERGRPRGEGAGRPLQSQEHVQRPTHLGRRKRVSVLLLVRKRGRDGVEGGWQCLQCRSVISGVVGVVRHG